MAEIGIPSTVGRPGHTPRSIQIPSTCSTTGRRAYTCLLTEKGIDLEQQSPLSTSGPLWDFEVAVNIIYFNLVKIDFNSVVSDYVPQEFS